MEITDCGLANILGAITFRHPNQIKVRLGIPLPLHRKCLSCGESIPNHRMYCSQQCQSEYSCITLSCHQCGQLFTRYQSEIISRTNKPHIQTGRIQEHWFCSQECNWRWKGIHYGFVAHPENITGFKRKWNWEAIWQLHLLTGFGAWKLHKYLPSLPIPTADQILRKMRAQIVTKSS